MVAEGTFRQDLYYRMNVMGIKSPALRDHADDIPVLARHFMEEYSRLYRRQVKIVAPAAMSLLLEYEWPGNVRELENAIQSAIIMCDTDTIQPTHLPEAMRQPEMLGVGGALAGNSFEEQLQYHKIRVALRAIEECNGNKTLAARSLRISRAYLHRLIRDPMDAEVSLPVSAPN